MTSVVYIKSYNAPEIDKKEILRYAGVRGESPEVEALLDECIVGLSDKLSYKVCYCVIPVSDIPRCFGDDAQPLMERLSDCEKTVLFAASVGVGIDRLIARYSHVSESRALIYQAIGSERVEALCDSLSSELRETYKGEVCETTHRFSPGYGDLSLEVQRDIFDSLE
ncbi:MAG: hypothetical protein IKV20_00160, partial [Clostridia bacterium]|nr:hypothetical protein [Clostridia bacterium]